jgi:hypothetical protein
VGRAPSRFRRTGFQDCSKAPQTGLQYWAVDSYNDFFDLSFEPPVDQQPQLGGVAAESTPFKRVLAVNLDIGDDDGQHPFMNVDSCYPVRHHALLPAGSGERACGSSNTVAGYRRSDRGRQRRPIIGSIRTLRIRHTCGLDLSSAITISPLRAATIVPRSHFHKLWRAAGPDT